MGVVTLKKTMICYFHKYSKHCQKNYTLKLTLDPSR